MPDLEAHATPGNSRRVTSNQDGIHPDLDKVVRKHQAARFRKPIADYVPSILENIEHKRRQFSGRLILDSACGTGESSLSLAARFPGDVIVGLDQSSHRLAKTSAIPENVLLLRADVVDVWCAMAEAGWQVDQHYLFYPNPWPKKKHLLRRWHGHPVFPALLKISKHIELRSNWSVYVAEFSRAFFLLTQECGVQQAISPDTVATRFVSPFEKKYGESGQALWSFIAEHVPDG